MASFSNPESSEDLFTLSSASPNHVSDSPITISQQASVAAFTAAQYSGVEFWALDANNAQRLLNGQSFQGYELTQPNQSGLSFVTLPAGNWWVGTLDRGLSGAQTVTGFDELSSVSLPGGSFTNNVPMSVSGNAGSWKAQSFTITGDPQIYIETEGSAGKFMIMSDSQLQNFEANYPNGYTGGAYSFYYALGGQNGGPSTEIEGQLQLGSGNWDLVWINDSGDWAGGAANISAFNAASTTGSVTPGSGTPGSGTPGSGSPRSGMTTARSDFTGNGVSGVLLQNGGTVADWIMQNGQYAGGNILSTAAAGWTVVGAGDFTGNGTADVLLQNGGTVADWVIQNGQYSSGNILSTAAAGWTVVGTGDFTGNGTDDVLLQNGATVVDWIMQNGQYQSGNILTTAASGWKVVGTGDFTGNGTDDVLLQNGGTVVDWIMQNGHYQTGNVLSTAAAGWTVVGAGDFTGDGTSDVLLQSGGTVVDWVMKDGAYQSGNVLTTGAAGWTVVGTGDYNGDGTSDVLLQNGGTVADWIMKNGAYQSGNILTTAASGWHVAHT